MKSFEILDLKKQNIWGGAEEQPQKTPGDTRLFCGELYTYCFDWKYANGDLACIKDTSESATKDPNDIPH